MSAATAPTAPARATDAAQVVARIQWRDPVVMAIMALLSALLALGTHGPATVSFAGATGWFDMGSIAVPAAPVNALLALVAILATGLTWLRALRRERVSGWLLVAGGVALVVAFLLWTVAGKSANLPVVSLLSGALMFATPLAFGSLAGLVGEHSGVINIAIEGQFLFGAFLAAVVASIFSNAWAGILGGPVAGVLVAVLLALFTVNFRADHIVVGVVLNMLVLGITSFLYSTLLKATPDLNQSLSLPSLPIPILSDIPVIGPVLFDQSILVYAMYVAVFALQFLVYRSRWGLRMRACGEHPQAADTVGIDVNRTRWRNVLIGGALAGLGGAVFTIGQGLAFSKDMAAGNGYIALAAMILGRWDPKGALAASLLFGFATNVGAVMQAIGASLPAEYLLMTPYLVTILAVAGFVGAVRAPAMEGKPYP